MHPKRTSPTTSTGTGSQFTILLAEDDSNDVCLVRLALQTAGINYPIHVVSNGQEAVDFLCGHGKYANRKLFPLPTVALLDIKMPKMSGLEVVDWLRHQEDERLKRLPVIIMSSSSVQEDIDRAYSLGVNAYLVKPNAFEELVEVLKTTTEFWRDTVAHPQIQ